MNTKICFGLLGLTFFLSVCEKVNAQAPGWLWAKGIPVGVSGGSDVHIAVDSAGNVYSTGIFVGTVDFDPGPGIFNLSTASNSYTDIYISKMDSSGNFVWARSMGGTNNTYSESIVLDPAGNIYVSGSFWGITDFNPDTGTFTLSTAGYSDIFISKLDNSGNFTWAVSIGASGDDDCHSIALDASGNVYATGNYLGPVDFDPGPGIYNLTGSGIFIVKLDGSGHFTWAKGMGGIGGGGFGLTVALDDLGALYASGTFGGTVDFDPGAGTFNITATGTLANTFFSKLDSSGDFVWAKSLGGTGGIVGYSMAVYPAGNGNVYATGFFADTMDFDPGPGIFNLVSAGAFDIFISKLDSGGNFVWAKRMGGTANDVGQSIAIDVNGSGDVYTTGNFTGTADFDPGAGIFNLSSATSGSDVFISKLDSSGNFVWAKAAGGSGNGVGYALAIQPSGNLYLAGQYYGILSFSSDTLAYGGNFIARLDHLVTGFPGIEKENRFSVYPNPASGRFTILLTGNYKKTDIILFDISGTIIFKTRMDGIERIEVEPKNVPDGMYCLQIRSEDFIETRKLIVAK